MSRTLVAKEFRDIRWKLVVAFLLLVVVITVMIIIYEQLLELLPADMSEMPFFFSSDALDSFRDYTDAMWWNFNDKNLIQFGCILAIVLGIGLLAPEIESGTITLLLTNGVSRKRAFWTKALLAAASIVVVFVTAGVLIIPLSSLFGYSLRHFRQIPATFITALGMTSVFAVSLLISLFAKDRIWSGVISAILFGAWSVLGFWESTRAFSPFFHMRATDYFFGRANFPWVVAVGFILVTMAVLLLAEHRFVREDL